MRTSDEIRKIDFITDYPFMYACINRGTYAAGRGAAASPALFQERQMGQAVLFNTGLFCR